MTLDIEFDEKRYIGRGGSLFEVVLDPSSPEKEPLYKHILLNRNVESPITDLIVMGDHLFIAYGDSVEEAGDASEE